MKNENKQIFRRSLALLLALSMMVSWLPRKAAAQETDADVVAQSGDAVMEGTDGLGTLLSQRVSQAQAEAETLQTQGGCVITELTVEGNTADVGLATTQDAVLVVAIYDEDQQKLLCSGKTHVTPETTFAQVEIEGQMPEFFRVRAYLADSYDMSPLCQAYETPLYTQAMRKLLASSASDYEADRVLTLEADKSTNFLVYGQDTLRIQEEAGANTVISADYENQVYVLGNVSEQVRALEAGNIFSYEYGDGQILIVKVASIEIDQDGTATITGAELALEDVFDYIKIEASTNGAGAEVTTPEGGSFTYLGSQEVGTTFAARDKDIPISLQHTIGIQYPREDYTPDWSQTTELSISGSLTLTAAGMLKLYAANGNDYVQLDLDVDFGFNLNVTGAARLPTEPMATVSLPLLAGATLRLQPTLELTFSGSVDFWASAEWDMGFIWEVGFNSPVSTGTPLRIKPHVELTVTVFVGIDLRPMVDIFNEHIFNVSVNIPIGLEVELKTSGTDYEEIVAGSTDWAPEKHSCGKCLDIKGTFVLRISVEVEFLNQKLGKTKGSVTIPLWKFNAYLSLSHGTFAFTQCPWKEFRTSIQILDAENRAAYNAAVKIGQSVYYTDENGLVNVYLTPGYRVIRIAHGNLVKDTTLDITGAGKAIIRMGTNSGAEFIYGAFEDGEVEDEAIRDHGEIVYSEEYGNSTWTLYEDGHMAVRGTGAMDRTIKYGFRDVIKTLSIESGITGIYQKAFNYCTNLEKVTIASTVTDIGDQAFKGSTSLTSVKIPDSVTRIGNEAFYGCTGLTWVALGDGPVTLGDSAFYGCTGLAEIDLGSGVASLVNRAFYGCSSLTSVKIPDSVTEISSEAFYGCTGLREVTFPNSVAAIGKSAFQGCSNLQTVTLPSGLSSMDPYCFYKCENLKTLVLPDTLAEIPVYSFGDCSGLTSITIPGSVTKIEDFAFIGSSVGQVVFLGDPPQIGSSAFSANVKTTAYYPADNANWTEEVLENYWYITWVAGLPPVEETVLEESLDAPTLDAIFGGDYGTESSGEKTASFTGLVPGEEYLLLCLVSLEAEDLLAPANILYIDQAAALEDGTLSFRYIPRTSVEVCYVMACGPSGKDLSDAEITFPKMGVAEEPKAVEPQVVCHGKQLVEGRDYMLLGDVIYQSQGAYAVTVLGIHSYSGAVVCTYTVMAEFCPNNPETGTHDWADADCEDPRTCILCGEIQGEKLEHTFENGNCGVCGEPDPDYVKPTDPDPTDPPVTEPKPTVPPATEPKPTDPPATEPKPTDPKPTDPTEPTAPEDPKVEGVTRLAGKDRLITSYLVADQLKEKLGIEKFQNIIVASGSTFADALPGSYLSAVKNAPILLTLSTDKYISQTADYIKANLANGGTVYILGGESAVPSTMEAALPGLKVQRVAGADRFGTNLEILKVAGVKAGDEILVCTAKEFADSLSASATGKPILLVYKKLTDQQKAYLGTLSGNSFCVVGGTTAVPDSIAKEMENYGKVSRLAGKDRLETSTMVAAKYFASAKTAVVAYGWNFPDGLCGGSLAYAMDAPLILTHSKTNLYTFTADYTTKAGLKEGYVLGGEGLVSDEAVRAIFNLGSKPISTIK